ncbi:MAG: type V CRISPR-associated protein Cas4 [Spirochaetia bacterium]|nr:type V CRISPR-associated protein Cas4 [Spirochaetia bacterium]
MESYILISYLNDFIFCPRSIYFHNIYGNYSKKNYHNEAQTKGRIAHKVIEENKFSTKKNIITNMEVYSERYNIFGKIDIYDSDNKILIERKRKIIKIYDGYRYQMYAQYYCMTEMGFDIQKLVFHSLSDNKRYHIHIPSKKEKQEFENVIEEIKSYNLRNEFKANKEKCKQCIYNGLCDYNLSIETCLV